MAGAVQGGPDASSLRSLVAREAKAAGFDAIGIAAVADVGPEVGERLTRFVETGRHGDMAWMADTLERRRHPAALWPKARTAIVLGLSYAPSSDPLARLGQPLRGVISCYAKGRDYHDIVKPALKRVARALSQAAGADVKVFVDTAPLMEKPIAAVAGLGWQGKHTNLVSREHGSWLLLGIVLTTALIVPDTAVVDHCGSCRRCLDACPTDAFPAPYQLDARRCISYLTIEHKGPIPHELRQAIGNRVYGCDDCLAACPWNKFAVAAREQRLAARPETDDPPLAELLALDDRAFRSRFAGTPVKRTGPERMKRNVLIAAGNAGDPALVPAVLDQLADPAPLVRGAAAWAAGQLVPAADLERAFTQRLRDEADPYVREEVRRAKTPAARDDNSCGVKPRPEKS